MLSQNTRPFRRLLLGIAKFSASYSTYPLVGHPGSGVYYHGGFLVRRLARVKSTRDSCAFPMRFVHLVFALGLLRFESLSLFLRFPLLARFLLTSVPFLVLLYYCRELAKVLSFAAGFMRHICGSEVRRIHT